MSNRLIIRIMLGLPLNEQDWSDLFAAAPELLQDELTPLPWFLHPYLLHIYDPKHPRLKELRAQWRKDFIVARDRAMSEQKKGDAHTHVPGGVNECPHPDCPLRQGTLPQTQGADDKPWSGDQPFSALLHLMSVPAHGQSPLKTFLNMASKLRGRMKNGVQRVIVTDPYVHCDKADDGTTGGHDALISLLSSFGLEEQSSFTLEITPSPKAFTNDNSLIDTPLAKKLLKRFPSLTLTTHKRYVAGFHDRFYLTVDGAGAWDGLFGPSLNGLASPAIALVGELPRNSPAISILKKVLDRK